MNRKINIFPNALIITFLVLNSCTFAGSYSAADSTKCDVQIENIINILGADINSLKTEFPGYAVKDTIMEDEDVRWKAKAVYKNDEKIFIAEANWQDSVYIHRVTIISPAVCTKNSTHIGMALSEIEAFVSKDILPSPDGYFGLADKYDRRINYWFNIDRYNNHLEMFDTYSKVPSDIRIENIVLMKY
jgi:hypothetical protein